MIEETNTLGKTRKFEYEGRLLVRKTDRNGRVIEFEYNDFGQPVAEKWLSTDEKLIETIAYQFDMFGKLERVVDSSGVQTFGYDELDRNIQTVIQLAGLETPITLENRFDDANRRTQVTAKIGGKVDFVNQYVYNALGKVTGIAQQGSDILPKQVEYLYNAAGQRTSTSVFADANKVYDTLYQYDGLGRLTDLTHTNGEKVFASYDFGWDAANRITAFDFTYLGDQESKTAEYGYDQTSQLVEAGYNAFQPNETYEYDANGNRKAFETGKNNQLISDGVFDYKYDNEGNRIEKKSKTGEMTKFVWDHRNRLVKVVMPKETVTYSYDNQNRMTRRNTEFVIHDGWQIVLTLDPKGNVKNRNLWGAKQDELIAANDQFTLCDHLGSVRDIVDAGGKVLDHIEYNAFGKVVKQTRKSDCIFGYTGKMFDIVTELQWNINRWYDAGVGRWISEDPIEFHGGDFNLNRYVKNQPIAFIDTNGLVLQFLVVCEKVLQIVAGLITVGTALYHLYQYCKVCTSTTPDTCNSNPPTVDYCWDVRKSDNELLIYNVDETIERNKVAGVCTRKCGYIWGFNWCCHDRQKKFKDIAVYRCDPSQADQWVFHMWKNDPPIGGEPNQCGGQCKTILNSNGAAITCVPASQA